MVYEIDLYDYFDENPVVDVVEEIIEFLAGELYLTSTTKYDLGFEFTKQFIEFLQLEAMQISESDYAGKWIEIAKQIIKLQKILSEKGIIQ